MSGYELILNWCKLFIMNKSFTTFSGNEVAYALLFPMEKVFEVYLGNILTKKIGSQYLIKLQDKTYHLFDSPKQFRLVPDIVLKTKDSVIILDTKWKLLSSVIINFGISQGDMYQMYTYSKKYNASKVFVLYPFHELIDDGDVNGFCFLTNDQVNVEILFVKLDDIPNSIQNIIKRIEIKN